MKSFIRTIMVLSVFGLAMGSFALAQDALEEAPVEAVAETSEPAASTLRPATRPPRVVTPAPPVDSLNTVVPSKIEPPGTFTPLLSQIGISGIVLGRGGGRKVLIIPAEEVKVEDLTAIWQDLYVMSRIFDKKFSKGSRLVREVFPDYGDFFRQDSRATEAIYVQGYGALFLMEANFPLTAPPKSKEKETQKTEEPADPIWQRAKQEIFDPMNRTTSMISQPEEKYDAEQIEEVKKELIKSLKHAANIRNLKPDEWVILTVTGAGRQPSEFIQYNRRARNLTGVRPTTSAYPGGAFRVRDPSYGGGGYGGGWGSYAGGGYGEMGFSSPTVLTIRAKKSDVDAFAKSELDFDKFREKVQIFTYPYLGQQVEHAHLFSAPPTDPRARPLPETTDPRARPVPELTAPPARVVESPGR